MKDSNGEPVEDIELVLSENETFEPTPDMVMYHYFPPTDENGQTNITVSFAGYYAVEYGTLGEDSIQLKRDMFVIEGIENVFEIEMDGEG